MSTNIPSISSFIYIPRIGFIPKVRLFLFSIMISLAVMFQFIPDIISQPVEAKPFVYNPHSQKEKIFKYIKEENANIDTDTAYRIADVVIEVEKEYKIPKEIQLALIRRESRFDKYALGSAGELGFCQILPKYHVDKLKNMIKDEKIRTKNIYDTRTNIMLSASILSDCLNKRKNNSMSNALACYNGTRKPGDYSLAIIKTAKEIKQII